MYGAALFTLSGLLPGSMSSLPLSESCAISTEHREVPRGDVTIDTLPEITSAFASVALGRMG